MLAVLWDKGIGLYINIDLNFLYILLWYYVPSLDSGLDRCVWFGISPYWYYIKFQPSKTCILTPPGLWVVGCGGTGWSF